MGQEQGSGTTAKKEDKRVGGRERESTAVQIQCQNAHLLHVWVTPYHNQGTKEAGAQDSFQFMHRLSRANLGQTTDISLEKTTYEGLHAWRRNFRSQLSLEDPGRT